MSSDLKPGDRALVVGLAPHRLPEYDGTRYNGTACTVETANIKDPYTPAAAGIGCVVEAHDGKRPWIVSQYLIRIPPDSEMRQMFRETEKTREAEHG